MKDKVLAAIEKFSTLEREMSSASGDMARMTVLAKERKKIEPLATAAAEWLNLSKELESLEGIINGDDTSLTGLAKEEKAALLLKFNQLEDLLSKLLNPPDPKSDRNVIVEIRAGAGGDESGLFAGELFRMYSRYAQKKGLDVEVFDSSTSGVGGLKDITFGISGPQAYGWFHFEQGVHRVQRVPATESQGRIHTSTVTVAVLPEATEVEIKIDMKDLRIDTYRASGAGGQHVNKTDSAIRITHAPTGIVVQCQEERSQGQNKMRAMSLLRAKLQEDAEMKYKKEIRDIRKKQVGTGDRSEKIRTYNFPQDRITDHRINVSVFNIERFLEGEMDELVTALQMKEEELRQPEKG